MKIIQKISSIAIGLILTLISVNLTDVKFSYSNDLLFSQKLFQRLNPPDAPILDPITPNPSTDGIIQLTEDFDLSSLNKDLYESKIDAIKNNFETMKKYQIPEDWLYTNYLKETHNKELV